MGSYFIIWKNNFISRDSSFPGEKLFSGEKPFFWGEVIFWGEAIFGEKPFTGEKPFSKKNLSPLDPPSGPTVQCTMGLGRGLSGNVFSFLVFLV